MKRFTLTECYEMLDVDPKTFRAWLARDNIQATPSKADPRVKYLTEDQVRFLAEQHERTLAPSTVSTEVIPPNAYKLLVDQTDKVERQVSNLVTEQQAVREALTEQETRVGQEITTLNGTLVERTTETQELVNAHHRQHEETIAILIAQVQHQVEQLHGTLTQQTTELRESVDLQRQHHESLATRANENQYQVGQLRDLMTQSDEQVQQRIQEVSTTFTNHYQEIQQAVHTLRTQATEQTAALHQQRMELEKVIDDGLRNVATDLQQVERDVAADAATTNERLGTIERKQDALMVQIEATKSIGLGAQQRVDRQNELIETLRQQVLELQQAPKKATAATRRKVEAQGE